MADSKVHLDIKHKIVKVCTHRLDKPNKSGYSMLLPFHKPHFIVILYSNAVPYHSMIYTVFKANSTPSPFSPLACY